MIIAFSFLSLLNENYKEAIMEYNTLTNRDWVHFDVMDGEFVTNTTFGAELVKEINTYNKLYSDVHLMCKNPLEEIKQYAKAGAQSITFHYEAVKKEEIMLLINEIRTYEVKVGISNKPRTNVEVLEEYLPYLDNILIMSVEPGKGGQKFIESSLDKVKYLRERQNNYHYLISIDGGINAETSKLVKQAGVDVIIVGTYLANNLNKKTMDDLK
jgi:ribulose-phosphate 3-epimerase